MGTVACTDIEQPPAVFERESMGGRGGDACNEGRERGRKEILQAAEL